MKTPSTPGPQAGAGSQSHPPLSLRDIVDALCAGMLPSAEGLEIALDRIEGAQR